MAHIVLKSRKEISSHLTTSSTRIPVMDQRGFEHSTRVLPHRDGRDARRDLHDRPAVSVHGLSASTPPDVDPHHATKHKHRAHAGNMESKGRSHSWSSLLPRAGEPCRADAQP